MPDQGEFILGMLSFELIDTLLSKFVYNFTGLEEREKKRKLKRHSTNYLRLITLFKIASFCVFLVDVTDKSWRKRIAEGSKILSGGH